MLFFKNLTDRQLQLVTAVVGAILFLPFLGRVHLFDWDEINFAEAAREMLVTGNYMRVQIDYAPFWEKPPLFIWCQALCMKLFGVNEFAARLPNALTGIATLVLLVRLGTATGGRNLGVLWALVYAGSLLPHFYFRSGIIDPLFNLFIFLGIYHLHCYYLQRDKLIAVVWAGFFVGLAVLTKGPVGYLLPGLCWLVYYILERKRIPFPLKEGALFTVVVVATTFLWFGVDLVMNGPWFLQEFITYNIRLFSTQDSGHGGPFFYHFVVLLVGCFPASVFVFFAWRKHQRDDNRTEQGLKLWMTILLLVTLILFSIVKTKIVHYSSLCYFPLTFLAAYSLKRLVFGAQRLRVWERVLLAVVGAIWALLFAVVPLINVFKESLLPLLKDPFAQANLQAEVAWSGWEWLIGLLYLGILVSVLFLIVKREDYLRATWLLFGGTALTICLVLPLIVPKVEGYSQRAALEFYEARKGEDCFVEVLDYKSYAHFFYTNRQPSSSHGGVGVPSEQFTTWLLTGPITKPAYFVTKVDRVAPFRDKTKYPELLELYSKNGFVFFKREAPKQ